MHIGLYHYTRASNSTPHYNTRLYRLTLWLASVLHNNLNASLRLVGIGQEKTSKNWSERRKYELILLVPEKCISFFAVQRLCSTSSGFSLQHFSMSEPTPYNFHPTCFYLPDMLSAETRHSQKVWISRIMEVSLSVLIHEKRIFVPFTFLQDFQRVGSYERCNVHMFPNAVWFPNWKFWQREQEPSVK